MAPCDVCPTTIAARTRTGSTRACWAWHGASARRTAAAIWTAASRVSNGRFGARWRSRLGSSPGIVLDELIGSSAGFTCRCLLVATDAAARKFLFKLNTAEDAPTILRFVTNYLAVEPTAQVAVVGNAGGIDFMLKDALDANGKPYADQLAALTGRGVAFEVCNNTLKARNLTAAAVSPLAAVVPGAVNEIIRLQTKEGYAHFRN